MNSESPAMPVKNLQP